MLLSKFNYDDLDKCKSVKEVFEVMGVGGDELPFTNKEVFGEKAYYRNMFIADETYQKVLEIMKPIPNYKGHKNPKNRLSYAAAQWCNFSPMSNGPRFEQVKELVGGEINRSVLYILTPKDELFEEEPTCAKS